MNNLLELDNVSVISGNNVRLKEITLSISCGEKVALLGKSGSGKSTLISVANGSLKPNRGVIKLFGKNIEELSRRRKQKLGTIWQDLRLVEELNVCQNINTGALGRHSILWAIGNLLGLVDNSKSLACMKALHLPLEIMNTQIANISGGQKQRVAIARLIRQQVLIALADEPFSNLDPTLSMKVLKLLLSSDRINSSLCLPKTILISIHRPDLLTNFTRVLGLNDGKLILDVPTSSVSLSDLNSLYQN